MTKIYKLKVETPVHFGAVELGGKESISFSYTSDTLFGALCCELAADEKFLAHFVNQARRGEILLSDLLPYKHENFYLPKPLLLMENQISTRIELREVRRQATQRKKQKKLSYIRAARFEEFFRAVKANTSFVEDNDFGVTILLQKISRREEKVMPYFVGSFSFADDCGFYLLASVTDELTAKFLGELLQSLGLSGIGGRKSSGFGKFSVSEIISLDDCANEDVRAIKQMLANDSATWQMNLSALLPTLDELPTLKKSFFNLRRRGGFADTTGDTGEFKKNSVCVVAAGSCFPERLAGSVVSLGTVDGHAIFRFGKSLYAGLPHIEDDSFDVEELNAETHTL